MTAIEDPDSKSYSLSIRLIPYRPLAHNCTELTEAEDEERSRKVLTKMVKNIKWLAGKFSSKSVALHSFSHLSTSRASIDFARQ